MIERKTKLWWKSKTLWFNAITACLVSLEASTGYMKPYLPEHWYVVVIIVLPMVNILLRLISNATLIKR